MNKTANTIRAKRKSLKMTQTTLATLSGLQQSDVSRVENGANSTLRHLIPITRVLRLSLQDVKPFCLHVVKAQDCELWKADPDSCIDCSNVIDD